MMYQSIHAYHNDNEYDDDNNDDDGSMSTMYHVAIYYD